MTVRVTQIKTLQRDVRLKIHNEVLNLQNPNGKSYHWERFPICVLDKLSVFAGQASLNAETVWGSLRGNYYHYIFKELESTLLKWT